MNFPNTQIWTVNQGPATLQGAFPFISPSIVLSTDGAGKITGTGWFWIDYITGPYSAFLVDVTGRISKSAKSATTVTLTLKGSGYSLDGNGGAALNKVMAKFVGQPGLDPSNTDNPPTIIGKLTGKITGASPLGEKKGSFSLDALLPESTSTPLALSAQVVQSGNKLVLYSFDFEGSGGTNPDFDLKGNGNINTAKETYNFRVKGAGPERGWSLRVNGDQGTYTGGSELPDFTFLAPVSATAKGKIQGQSVSDQTTNITAEVITGT
ncbi:MAG TPA: hypothetical protein VHH88_11655 [Verrucomicrobiae bacterium]|nr:hypothetical protein [Verrucomicrobiae bacterium]